jgi:hypothetical protein
MGGGKTDRGRHSKVWSCLLCDATKCETSSEFVLQDVVHHHHHHHHPLLGTHALSLLSVSFPLSILLSLSSGSWSPGVTMWVTAAILRSTRRLGMEVPRQCASVATPCCDGGTTITPVLSAAQWQGPRRALAARNNNKLHSGGLAHPSSRHSSLSSLALSFRVVCVQTKYAPCGS